METVAAGNSSAERQTLALGTILHVCPTWNNPDFLGGQCLHSINVVAVEPLDLISQLTRNRCTAKFTIRNNSVFSMFHVISLSSLHHHPAEQWQRAIHS